MLPVREVEPSGLSNLGSPLIKNSDLYIQRKAEVMEWDGCAYILILLHLVKPEGNCKFGGSKYGITYEVYR